MAIDPSIILQGKPVQMASPLTTLSQVGQVQAQQQEQQLRGQQIQQGQMSLAQAGQEQQDSQDVRAAMAAAVDPNTGQINRSTLLSTLGKLNPLKAAQTATTLAAQDTASAEAQAKLQKAQFEAAQTHVDAKDKLLQGVNDQATYTNALNQGYQLGILKPGDLPNQYDPQLVAQLHAQTLSQKDALAIQAKKREDDETAKRDQNTATNNQAERDQAATNAKETARHNKADEGIQVAKVSIDRQKLKDEESDPAGTGGTPAPTVADRNRASLALIARNSIDKMADVVNRRGDMIGPGPGRISNIDQLIGSNDPDLVALTNEAHNFSMANAGVHGSRSVQNVRDAVKDLLGDLHNGAEGVKGGLKANRDNLNAVIDQGFAPVKMKAPTGQVTAVPYSQIDHYKALGAKVVTGAQ